MVRHNINKQNNEHELHMGYLEYLAVLVSPHPKETMKAIEARVKASEASKIKSGEVDAPKQAFFEKEHKNTTFYESILAEGGTGSLDDLKTFFGDKPEDSSSVEMYQPRAEDMMFLEKALQAQDGNIMGTPINPEPVDFDTVEF